ncbi:ABC transporter ATP-binding protein [Methylomonas lenta]|uniref:ABC transporter ATP-binding protein n=1 Tax=Methylomonas lenta TaxID=980561 RepID=A0A177MXN3_9GAMM|nr:ABC transporter ATP-binding protein [Methylomonas lenta]OAI09649.1 ABC transporter ATP-binding protein [Methylomonas lenta]
MSASDIAIKVENLSKCYQIYDRPQDRLLQMLVRGRKQYYREFWALKDVSFEIKKGETFGIIGRNGSGKSTLLQILAGTLSQTSGEVKVNGRIAALLELGSGFNPEFTGKENVLLNGRILGLSPKEIESRYDQIVEFADIGEFINQPVKTYSSGMFVRLAFAVQAHIDASIVIIDEALAVGDIFFRQKCYARLEQLRNSGAAILLVSHAMPEVEQFCKQAILLDHGMQRFIGSSSEAAKHYYLLHQPQARGVSKPAAESTVSQASVVSIPITERPSLEAFIDISNKAQVTNGQARCIGVALCNIAGEPCKSFRQGDTAVFYYEFELAEYIGIPICGLTIINDKGVIVHGKNSWQSEANVLASYGDGSKVVCRQEISLDIAPSEYTFQVGLAYVSEDCWNNRKTISHEEEASKVTRVCHVPQVGLFSVRTSLRDGINFLMHHGVANLQGKITISTVPKPSN